MDVPIQKYSKQRRNSSCGNHAEKEKYRNENISTFLGLVLTLSNFVFNCQNYLHIKGCTMGTKYAPNYANIFMGMFEERYEYHLIEITSKFYLGFIVHFFNMNWNYRAAKEI